MNEEHENDIEFARGPETFQSLREYELYCLRHSTSHILAAAVQQIFPDVKFGIGPPVKDRFYYDMDLPRPLSALDLEEIERRMAAIIASDQEFRQEFWNKETALDHFGAAAQPFKVELISGLSDDRVSIYKTGDFIDLCAGPHVHRASQCRHFKLLSVSGAYWRGHEGNPMLQRIYGTAWPTRAELDEYLHNLEEAKWRDHRKLGRELELFMINEWAPGAIFWLPKGTVIYQMLQSKMRRLLARNGYQEVKAPVMANSKLFEQSGHLEHYRENMFTLTEGEQLYGLKPMNCPWHMLIYGAKRRSYRELPLRLAEQTILHRNERKGVLSGLTRVRQFQQDDSHIFVTEEQIGDEVTRILNLIERVYTPLNMPYRFVLSTRNESNYMGELNLWEKAEAALRNALEVNNLPYEIRKGDAAFYGPKIDQLVQDSLNREHQLATIQADFQLPRKFSLTYINDSNTESVPVVIHRAIYGSLERFIGILIEHFAGAFPIWLSPIQVKILPISDKTLGYARRVYDRLLTEDIRVQLDTNDEKIGAKIRMAQMEKTPYMLVIGPQESKDQTVAIRSRELGREGVLQLEDFIGRIKDEVNFSF
jgi:threonyl-tRNA synthetase